VNLEKVDEKLTPEILSAIAEIQQPRSQFQLEKFVVNQHDTDEMRYFQTLIEIQQIYYTIRSVSLDVKKAEIEVERLRATKDEVDEIDAQIKELGLEQTHLIAIGAFRELELLINIFNSFPKKFTRAEIEEAQPEYWLKRMHRQTTLEFAAGGKGGYGHLDSLRQMGVLKVTENGIESVAPLLKLAEITD